MVRASLAQAKELELYASDGSVVSPRCASARPLQSWPSGRMPDVHRSAAHTFLLATASGQPINSEGTGDESRCCVRAVIARAGSLGHDPSGA